MSKSGPESAERVMAIGCSGPSLNRVQWRWDEEEYSITVAIERAIEVIPADYWSFRDLDLLEVASKKRENIKRGAISSRSGLQAASSHPQLGELGWELHRGAAGHEFILPMTLEWMLIRRPDKIYIFGMGIGRIKDALWRKEMGEIRRLELKHKLTTEIIGLPQKYYSLYPESFTDAKADKIPEDQASRGKTGQSLLEA